MSTAVADIVQKYPKDIFSELVTPHYHENQNMGSNFIFIFLLGRPVLTIDKPNQLSTCSVIYQVRFNRHFFMHQNQPTLTVWKIFCFFSNVFQNCRIEACLGVELSWNNHVMFFRSVTSTLPFLSKLYMRLDFDCVIR